MREPGQKFVAPVFEDDRLGDHGAESGHALPKPSRHAAAVQRQIGAARPRRHQRGRARSTRANKAASIFSAASRR